MFSNNCSHCWCLSSMALHNFMDIIRARKWSCNILFYWIFCEKGSCTILNIHVAIWCTVPELAHSQVQSLGRFQFKNHSHKISQQHICLHTYLQTPTHIHIHVIQIKTDINSSESLQFILMFVLIAADRITAFILSGGALYRVNTFTEKAVWPKVARWKRMEQSLVDILGIFLDSSGQKLIKWHSRGGAKPFRILNISIIFENSLKLTKLWRWCFSRILQW